MKLLKKWRHIIDWYFFQSEKAGRAEAVNFISHLFIYSFFLFFPFVFSVLFIYNEQNRWYCYQQIRLIFHFSCYVTFFSVNISCTFLCFHFALFILVYLNTKKKKTEQLFYRTSLVGASENVCKQGRRKLFYFLQQSPPKKRNLDQNVNDSKFHFVILFLKIIFQTYTNFSYLSKRSSGHHQGFLWFQIF